MLERLASAEPELRERARAAVASAYWNPLYKYLRLQWKLPREDAEDLVQGFLATAFEKGWLDRFDPARARFRTFVRVCADRYVANWRQAATRAKRGAGAAHLALDFPGAEAELGRVAPVVDEDRDAFFQREFVRDLFGRAVDSVRRDFAAAGRERQFALFERYDLADQEPVTYADLAREHDLTVAQVTNHLHSVRRAFRERVIARLREVCGTEEEFRAEAREILGVEWP